MGKRNKKGKRPGRNDPCPCGSGRKAKTCCGPATTDATGLHDLDHKCVDDLVRAVHAEFGAEAVTGWLAGMPGPPDHPAYLQLQMPYLAYHGSVDGQRFLDWYLEAHGERLRDRERSWLESQQRSWLSIWEVLGVKRGVGLELQDVLTGERRYVHEVSLSKTATLRMQICARIVDHGGISLLCGLHPASLQPSSVAVVLEAFEAQRGGGAISTEALRGMDSLLLLEVWEDEIQAVQRRPLPTLENSDGDPLLPTVDRFVLPAGAEIVDRLAALPGYHHDGQGDDAGEVAFRVVRANEDTGVGLEPTLLGSIRIVGDELLLETNSTARADALRNQIELACSGLIDHAERTQTDMIAEMMRAGAGGAGLEGSSSTEDTGLPPEFAAQLEREFKERHYAAWPDGAIPALGGLSPRQAAQAGGPARAQLELLLQDLEHMEAKLPRDRRYDVSRLRRALNMTP